MKIAKEKDVHAMPSFYLLLKLYFLSLGTNDFGDDILKYFKNDKNIAYLNYIHGRIQ